MTLDVVPTGKTTATVILTQEQVDAIRGEPGRGRVMLAIAYEDRTYRTSIAVYRGQWMMVVNKQMCDGGLVPGASYEVDISVDTAERTVEVPEDLAAALDEAGLRSVWDELSHTTRKEHARLITDAKKPETREKRMAKILGEVAAKA